MLRLLIVFFQGMFFKLVFCKLQNMRWTHNVTSIICIKKPPVTASKVLPNYCCVNGTFIPIIRLRKEIVLSLQSGKSSILKSHDHNFFTMCVFCKEPFFLDCHIYLPISSELFVTCHFCKEHVFQITSRGAFFVGCIYLILLWFLFFCSYVDNEFSLRVSTL